MAFEKFTQTGRGFKPKVSILNRGQLGFNQGAIKHFGLENFGYIIYFYDADDKKIGIRFTNDEAEEGATKLKIRGTGASAALKSFLDYYGINYDVTRRYDIDYDKENELYVINLLNGEEEGAEEK